MLSRGDGRVLLVVNALGDQRWSLPGGGVERGETDKQAILREIHEELHLNLEVSRLKWLGDVPTRSYVAPVFYYDIEDYEVEKLRIKRFEIREYVWTKSTKLPVGSQEFVTRALALVDKQSNLLK